MWCLMRSVDIYYSEFFFFFGFYARSDALRGIQNDVSHKLVQRNFYIKIEMTSITGSVIILVKECKSMVVSYWRSFTSLLDFYVDTNKAHVINFLFQITRVFIPNNPRIFSKKSEKYCTRIATNVSSFISYHCNDNT